MINRLITSANRLKIQTTNSPVHCTGLFDSTHRCKRLIESAGADDLETDR